MGYMENNEHTDIVDDCAFAMEMINDDLTSDDVSVEMTRGSLEIYSGDFLVRRLPPDPQGDGSAPMAWFDAETNEIVVTAPNGGTGDEAYELRHRISGVIR